ncbi:MAG: LacI family transcriptional regulator [Fusobacterium mortiferum]|nr:LacI family transcriptional regulator [Fusobacterium mortiferum]
MLNSTEIAKLAGVSRSTVSKVLNGYSNISEETKKKVLEIVKTYNYVPDSNAQALAGKTNSVIGIFIYEKDYESDLLINHGKNFVYFTDFINSCTKEAFLYKHQILVDVIKDDFEEARVERFFKNGSIAGGIFIGLSQENEFIKRLMEKNYKLALIDYKDFLEEENENVILINIKDYEAAYRITKKLLNKGAKKILYISGDEKKRTGIERKRGYKAALQEFGIEFDENLVISSNFQREDSYKKIKEFFKKGVTFDAVFSSNDTMAYSYLDVIKELNIYEKLKNLPLWGYDNLKYTFIQGIKTAAPNFNEAAVEAIKALIDPKFEKGGTKEIEVNLIETLEDYLKS